MPGDAATRASPMTACCCRLHAALQARLAAAGSGTEVVGTSYTQGAGEPRIRFTLRGVRRPSDRTWEVISQGALDLAHGSGLTPKGSVGAAETTYQGALVFFPR